MIKVTSIYLLLTVLAFVSPHKRLLAQEPQEQSQASESKVRPFVEKTGRRWRLPRQVKKVFDEDLIPHHELPPNQFYRATKRGYRNLDTGQLYDRKWLEEKKAREKKSGRS